MNHVAGLALACLVLLGGCATSTGIELGDSREQPGSEHPEWYVQSEYPERESLIVKGYGSGVSPPQARVNALEDISRQLGVTIRSEASQYTRENVSDMESRITEEYVRQVRAEATHHIKDWRLIRSEQHGNRHYAVVVLDRRAAPVVIAERIEDALGYRPGRVDWEGPEGLIASKLVEQIEARLQDGFSSRLVRITLHLRRIDEQWHLRVKPDRESEFFVALDEPDMTNLFQLPETTTDGVLQLSLRPLDILRGYNRLRVGDWFVFELAAKKQGYVTLFNIYQDGRVSLLDENRAAEPDGSLHIPRSGEQEKGEAFMAFPLEDNRPTQDLYLAILSSGELPTADFQRLLKDSPPVDNESSYQIHRLMEWLDTNRSSILGLDAITVLVQP